MKSDRFHQSVEDDDVCRPDNYPNHKKYCHENAYNGFKDQIDEDEEGVISKALVTGVVKSIIQDGGVEEAVIAETQFESEF